jgi:P-type Cu2+ transporter
MIIKNPVVSCKHCGLAVPQGMLVPQQEFQFCCYGCQTAHQLITSSGLDAFYLMVDSSNEAQSLRGRQGEQNFVPLDDPSFLTRFARPLPDGGLEIRMALDGIHCAACVWLIEKLPTLVSGVTMAQVNWSRATIRLQWNPQQTSLSIIARSLYRLGYTAHPIRLSEKAIRRQYENRQHLARIGMAGAAAGNNMLIGAALYLGLFATMEASFVSLFRWLSCLIGLASLLGPGRIFLRGGWIALRTRTPHMDLPIAVGLLAGTINGLINTIRGSGEIYFDSLSVLIFLLLIGRWIQFHQQNRAADAVELLYRLTPQRARKLIGDQVNEVLVEEIQVGDQLEIRPGDLIATDAQIVEGQSAIDESILSGESKPITKQRGDPVSAGTRNISQRLVVRATAVGEETRISKIVELVEQAASQKPQIVQWANRIGGYFVVVILLLALLTFAFWYPVDAESAVDHAIALLVIACPCALAMATPLAISVALGKLAKRQIMVKSGDVMQSLSKPGMIWLDKTGTLTEGQMRVIQWYGDANWIATVAAIEQKFTHPVALALVRHAQENSAPFSSIPISDWMAHSNGVEAAVMGQHVLLGNRTFLKQQGIDVTQRIDANEPIAGIEPLSSNRWHELEQDLLARQSTPCWCAVNGRVVALIGLGDRIRDDAAATLKLLKQSGWDIGVLSGDHPAIVQGVANQLGIKQMKAGVTPEEKLAIIKETSQHYATTVMVGDGVNDSAALAAATVGIAVHNGAEASLAAAPVYLGNPGLRPVVELLVASHSTCYAIRRNLGVSLFYNAIGATLAMAGLLHPLLAAVLMPISSVTVIGLSLRAGKISASA